MNAAGAKHCLFPIFLSHVNLKLFEMWLVGKYGFQRWMRTWRLSCTRSGRRGQSWAMSGLEDDNDVGDDDDDDNDHGDY